MVGWRRRMRRSPLDEPPEMRLRASISSSHLIKMIGGQKCKSRPRLLRTAIGGAGLWSREILPQSGGDLFQRPVDLIAGDNKRRGDANRVPMCVLGEDASG